VALYICCFVGDKVLEDYMKIRLLVFLSIMILSCSLYGAASFAEAIDRDGNAITWTFYFEDGNNANRARTKAVEQLKEQGHANVKATVSTTLNKGHYAVLYAAFMVDGVLKKAFSYGFSAKSEEDAQNVALENMKKVKGWTVERGYTVNKTGSF